MLQCNFHYVAMPMMMSQISKSGFHKNMKIKISREQRDKNVARSMMLSSNFVFI